MCRLLEYAPNYFDLSTFPDDETKRALLRVQKRRSLEVAGTGPQSREENLASLAKDMQMLNVSNKTYSAELKNENKRR